MMENTLKILFEQFNEQYPLTSDNHNSPWPLAIIIMDFRSFDCENTDCIEMKIELNGIGGDFMPINA